MTRSGEEVRLRIYAKAEKQAGGEMHRHNNKPTTIKTYRNMNKEMNKETFVAFATQKGGVGKSTVTALVANYVHNVMGRSVAVIDCDEPQHSIAGLRDKETVLIEKNDSLKAVACEHFRKSGRKAFPIIRSNAVKALDDADRLLSEDGYRPEIVFFDLPGTLKSDGVIKTLSQMDYIFTPISADKVVLESSLSFAVAIQKLLVRNEACRLAGLYLFWNMVDGREKTDLYAAYDKTIKELELPLMKTFIPDTKRYKKELMTDRKAVFRSTLFPASRPLVRGSNLEELITEMMYYIKLQ